MHQYLDGLRAVLEKGEDTDDRTGTGTRSLFGMQMRYPLADGFPLVTTKRLYLKAIIHELIWFLAGDTNIKYLTDNNVTIWNEWADEQGNLGPVYGSQWRDWGIYRETEGEHVARYSLDQIAQLVRTIQTDPHSRRMIVTAWNPAEVDKMALPPCHTMWQVKVIGKKMHLQLYQRSGDMFLGIPFNIASYALLLKMLAHVTGYEAGDFIHTIGDAHIYLSHMDQVHEQLTRAPRALPTLRFGRDVKDIFDFRFDDIIIEGYDPAARISAPVAV